MQQKIKAELEQQNYIYQECCNSDCAKAKQAVDRGTDEADWRSHAEANRFFNLSLDMLVIANLDGYFINLNPACERILGFTLEELRSQPYLEFVHPEDWAKTRVEMEKLIKGIPVTSFENRYRCKDGSYKYLAWTGVPFLEEELIYAVARDVTHLKQTEAALRENQQLLQEIIDAAPIDIFLKDLQGRYLLINRSGEKTTGLSREQVIGKTDYDLFPTETADAFRTHDLAVLQARKPIDSEEIVPQADGQNTVIAIKFPLYDSSGAPSAICGIATDITGRKRMEEELYQRKQAFRALAENSPDLIFRIDKQMRHLYVNAALETLTGISPSTFIGKTYQELGISEEKCTESQENFQYVFTTKSERIVECNFLTPQGTTRNYQTRLVPEFAIDGSVESILGVSRDVTQFKETEKALRESKQLLQALLDAAPMAIYLKDLQGRYILCNRYSLRPFGLNSEEVIGKNIYGVFPSEIADLFQVSDKAALEAGGPIELEEVFPEADGLHTYITTKFPLCDAANNPYGVCGISVDITGRKLAETALFESEERFRQLAENMDAVSWILSLEEQRMLYISPAYKKIWGRSPEILQEHPQKWLELIHPEDRPKMLVKQQKLMGGEYLGDNYRIIRPDGSIRWIQDHVFPVRNSQGKVYRLAGISEDITGRKLAETALRESEERFRQLADNIDAVFWVSSLDEPKILYISPAYEKIWGRSSEILLENPHSFIDAIHPEDLPRILTRRQRLIQGECIEEIYRIIKPDGSIRWVNDRAFPIYNSQGKLYRSAGIAEDITERIMTEAALKKSEQKYRHLIETSQGIIWSVNTEGILTFVNPAALKLYGYEAEEVIGRNLCEFTSKEPTTKDRERFQRLLASDSIIQYEAEWIHKNGTRFYLSCNLMAIRDNTGKILGITGTAVDITERKKAEEQLKLSLQEKEALLKEVHHRVKNNLQVISSLLDLQSQQIQDPLTMEVFRASQNRVKSISLIHEKLYQSDNLARVNLAEYIQSLTSYLLQTYPINPNNISLQLQVKQIYLNLDIVIPCGLIINELVSNALKHGFPGNTKGTIWVCLNSVCLESTEKQGQQFTLVIGNNGMKLQDQENFDRPKSLGFQLVNALVKQLQGTIEITQSPGTEFKIKFFDTNH